MTAEPSLPRGETNRIRIMERVLEQPGIHKSVLCRELGLAWGTVSHHLSVLQARCAIQVAMGAREARLFPVKTPSTDKQWIDLLRNSINKMIIDLLSKQGDLPAPDIGTRLGLAPNVVHRHIITLERAGFVRRQAGRSYQSMPRVRKRLRHVEMHFRAGDGGRADPDDGAHEPHPPIRDFGPRLSPLEHQRRLAAYHGHDGDADASRSLGISPAAFGWWRHQRGLPAKRSNRLPAKEEARRRQAYATSHDDADAARRLGMNRAAFGAWRRSRGLDARRVPPRPPTAPPTLPPGTK